MQRAKGGLATKKKAYMFEKQNKTSKGVIETETVNKHGLGMEESRSRTQGRRSAGATLLNRGMRRLFTKWPDGKRGGGEPGD